MLRVYTPTQSIAHKELSFEIGLCLQIKKLQKFKRKTLYASKEENEEMSKSKTKISTRMYLRHVFQTRVDKRALLCIYKCVHSGGQFEKYSFTEIINVVYVWTGGLNAQKNISFYERKRIRVDGA